MAVVLGGLVCPDHCRARDFPSLGHHEQGIAQSHERDCLGVLVYNHDSSFEYAYCWDTDGCIPPYYGAFAEAFDVGAAVVECGLYWLTEIGYMPTAIVDVYIWQGGITGPPGDVLFMEPDVNLGGMGAWPQYTLCEAPIGCCVDGEFSVGLWADFSLEYCLWYVCSDESGDEGHPWTHIAPGIGYPTGWQHPNVVFPNCVSMGIGATVIEDPSPVGSRTWGAIKALF
jgi:hypothetical protein